jgi:ParB family chromosome partitioning protein
LQEVLEDDDLDRNQKARSVRRYLRQRRFPAIMRAEVSFERHVRDLKLGNQMKLTPPANFEGDVYTLSMGFRNLAELKSLRTSFDQLIQNPSLEKILS